MSKEELLTKINQLDLVLEAPKEIDSIMRTLISLGIDKEPLTNGSFYYYFIHEDTVYVSCPLSGWCSKFSKLSLKSQISSCKTLFSLNIQKLS